MREIKLRYVFRKPSGHIIKYFTDIQHLEHGDITLFLERNLVTLERDLIARNLCPGLYDKNGKGLYERDICQEDGKEGVFEIVWHPLFFAFMAEGEGRMYLGEVADFTIDEEDVGGIPIHSPTIEIIGNIYENPELLPKEE